jgi:hypothetical protein
MRIRRLYLAKDIENTKEFDALEYSCVFSFGVKALSTVPAVHDSIIKAYI